MTQNPFVNAIAASLYIVCLVSFMFYVLEPLDDADTILMPISMLSLFVLSAAVMGYLFMYQPAALFLAGEKEKGVSFFLQTVATFAAITVALVAIAFSIM